MFDTVKDYMDVNVISVHFEGLLVGLYAVNT